MMRELGRGYRGVKQEANPQKVDPTHLLASRVAELVQGDRSYGWESVSAYREGGQNPKNEGQEQQA